MKLDSNINAVITGGASGLGEATARQLAERGVRVAIFDMNAERGEVVARDIGGVFCAVDVTDPGSIAKGLSFARKAHGQEHILVNCAGVALAQKTARRKKETGEPIPHDLAAFAKVIQVNLIGTFNMIAQCSVGMMANDPVTEDGTRGVIINTSSVAAQDGQIGQVAYSASKGGVASLTLPVARDLSTEGIRVATILPGLFHTPMFDGLSDDVRNALAASVPFPKRLGRPAEYAQLAVHIAENEMINGECIRLDGAVRLAPR